MENVRTHQLVDGSICLNIDGSALSLSVTDCNINQTGVTRLISGRQDERWVGRGILIGRVVRHSGHIKLMMIHT